MSTSWQWPWRRDFDSRSAGSEAFSSLIPADLFFDVDVEVAQSDCTSAQSIQFSNKHLLPLLGKVWGESSFSTAYMGWSQLGLFFQFDVKSSPIACYYPDVERGDSIELFIDTRHNRATRLPTRFCHHFFFLPEKFEGKDRGEISELRQDEIRPLVSPDSLDLQIKKNGPGYTAKIFIPQHALFGYQPKESILGFTYRINRSDDVSDHFTCGANLERIDKVPSRWAALILK